VEVKRSGHEPAIWVNSASRSVDDRPWMGQ